MALPEDTIVAVATPPGRGGLGIVRLSGPGARPIAAGLVAEPAELYPRHATFTRLSLDGRRPVDHAVITFFQAPASYTGEDVVEISAHGSPVLLREIVEAAVAGGARLAGPGEFTLRAFLNGRIDLVQAEAVSDLIAATTPLQARAAFDQLDGTLTARIEAIDGRLMDVIAPLEASLDFPEEGYHFIAPAETAERLGAIAADVNALVEEGRRGRLIREGITAAVVGRPNVGKSSVFNRLAGADRAIVTESPGTTRDLITEGVEIEGIPVTLVDTAGLRDAADAAEAEGVRRARRSVGAAELLIVVLDGSEPLREADASVLHETKERRRVVAVNKSDRPEVWNGHAVPAHVRVSAKTGEGFADLRRAIARAAGAGSAREPAAITNVRHIALLERAGEAIARARASAADGASEELVLADLHDARGAFEDVTGRRSADDLLNEIFGRFCIGK